MYFIKFYVIYLFILIHCYLFPPNISCYLCPVKINPHILVSFLLFISLLSPALAQQQPTPLSISLVVPAGADGVRTLSLVRNPRFHVVLTNTSATPLNLWKDWTSWGQKCLTLVLQQPSKTSGIVRLPLRAVDRDFPDFWILSPGESLVLEINMTDPAWRGLPDLYGESIRGSLQAIYEIKQDYLTDEFNIWTGRVISNAIDVKFEN